MSPAYVANTEELATVLTAKDKEGAAVSGLDAMFRPNSVAVIGATERVGTVGRTVLANLMDGRYRSRVFPVNPGRAEVLGLKAYKRIGEVPQAVDLAVVVTPARSVPGVIGECVDAGVKAAVVISAGFRERGAEGAGLEREIQSQLRRTSMRVVGPNCLGIMTPALELNATFANRAPKAGNVAFLSQSGALLTSILDWSEREQVGFSAIVSTGSMLDVGWGDLLDYFGDDPATESILVYMESVGDARSFVSAAREVSLRKPIIVIKAGRSEAAAKAAASHTGALTGSDDVLDAAFRRCGVLRVYNIADLFYMAEALSKQPRPLGPRLTIVTNAGGPAVLATDALMANGGELAKVSEDSLQKLDAFLPRHWSHNNPIDILGDADPERYAKALDIAAKDPNSDGLLVILSPQGMTNPAEVAERLQPYAKGSGKPLLASWMGGVSIGPGEQVLNAGGIPTFPYPDTAARVFTYMWRYSDNLRSLYETPEPVAEEAGSPRSRAAEVIELARSRGRTILTEFESKRILSFYGIPTVETRVAKSEEEAVHHAAKIGYPVVLKVFSETITHKTDVGGVHLNLMDRVAVRGAFQAIREAVQNSPLKPKEGLSGAPSGSVLSEHFLGVTVQPMVQSKGYELILGSSVDPQFGPVLLFGSGGQLVEVYRDRAVALPPLNSTQAQRLMEQTLIYKALKGVRGRKAVDLKALEDLMVRFSQLVVEQPWIAEIDLNPLLASPEGLVALDARVLLHDPRTKTENLPKPAIRPYPAQYISAFTMKDGGEVTLRPIRPEDEPLMRKFHETLSDRSVYMRYFSSMSLRTRVAHERLARICLVDYDRQIALVADRFDPASGEHSILGVGRLIKLRGKNEAELAILVSDAWQKQGLGKELLARCVRVAREEKLSPVSAEMLRENLAVQKMFQKAGFGLGFLADAVSVRAVLNFGESVVE